MRREELKRENQEGDLHTVRNVRERADTVLRVLGDVLHKHDRYSPLLDAIDDHRSKTEQLTVEVAIALAQKWGKRI
ncbi:hypothetical protein BH10BDE1_BH10BDE1_27870 [soil metagenome]